MRLFPLISITVIVSKILIRKTRKIKSIKFTSKSNCIKRGSCHLINIEKNAGIFKVTDMTRENKVTYIHGSIFVRPEHLENELPISFGEHEVVKATRPVSVPLCCFKDLLTDIKSENIPILPGVQSYKHEKFKITDIESEGYLKLKNPSSRILDNISGSLEMKSILEKATDKVRFRRYENKSINDDASRKTNDAPTIDILNYRDYCRIRKLKAGLEAGLLIHEDKLKAEQLISSVPKYFMFSEMFIPDRQIQKWCRKNEMQINLDFKQKAIQKRKHDSISHQDEIDDNMYKKFYDAPVISEYKLTKVKYERTRLKKRKIID